MSPRPNPGHLKPDRDRTYYVAALVGLLQELDALAYRMLHDRALRHWQPTSYATATAYVARFYRACVALWFVLDLLHYKDHYDGTLLATFVTGSPTSAHTFHYRERLQHETKVRIIERLARVADQTPQTEAAWERAFVARQTAVVAIRKEIAALTTQVRTHMGQDPEMHTPLPAGMAHADAVRARVAGFAKTLHARILADAVALKMPCHSRHDRWVAWLARLVSKHHARAAVDAAIEASARARGYL